MDAVGHPTAPVCHRPWRRLDKSARLQIPTVLCHLLLLTGLHHFSNRDRL
jgi:hypothetical protein